MPRTVPPAIASAIQSPAFSLPTLVHIAFADGSVSRYTNWDRQLQTDMAGEGISPAPIYYPNKFEGLSTFSAQINSPIDDVELTLIINGSDIVADDIRRGVYDGAVVTRGYVLPDNLANPWLYAKYDVGQANISGLRIKLELLGPEKRLEQPAAYVLTAGCPFMFGDADCGIQTTADAWEASTLYPVRSIVQRATGSGILWFKALGTGTSGATEPIWPTILGATVVDGGLTWTAIRGRRLVGTVSSVTDRRVFTATGITVINDYFGEGFLTFLTGANAGDVRRVRADNGSGQITLHMSAFNDIAIGDTFDVVVGCRKRLAEDCVGKHDNETNSRTRTLRFGGDPYLAEENVSLTAPAG